jgi:hypothetical protein
MSSPRLTSPEINLLGVSLTRPYLRYVFSDTLGKLSQPFDLVSFGPFVLDVVQTEDNSPTLGSLSFCPDLSEPVLLTVKVKIKRGLKVCGQIAPVDQHM